jgi:dipeptide transport system substrate-binding protein
MSLRSLLAIGVTLGMAASAPAWSQTLVVCTEASPAMMNPQLTMSGTVFDVAAQIYDQLVEMEQGTSKLVPALAESWTISPDGRTYTFKLRHGVKWQSNQAFTPTRDMNADDVVFSFRRQTDKTDPWYSVGGASYDEWNALLAGRVSAVTKVDDYTVRFDLSESVAPLLGILSMPSFAVFSAEYAAKMMQAGTPDLLDANPIGTGPFSMVRYQRDSNVRMRAFEQSWVKQAGRTDRTPGVQNLVFTITPDPAVRLAKLRANECQVARYPNPADFPAIRANPDLSLVSLPMAAMGYIGFKNDAPPFDKKEVRQALAEAIDMKSLVAAVFEGTGEPTGALISPSLWGHNPDVKPYPYDPAHARKLLEEAGYKDGFKTQVYAIPVARPYMPNGRKAAEMIQADWAKIGVKADIVTYEWGEYLKRVRAGEAPVGMLGGSWDYPDPSQLVYGYWACPDGKLRPGNWPRWCNAPFSDLVARANTLTDQNERAKLYVQAQQIFHDEVPGVLFANTAAFAAIRKSVVGFKPHLMGGQPYTGISVTP